MSRLLFDYFIWIDADTIFTRNPDDPLGALYKSPLHVPLELNLSTMAGDAVWRGLSCQRLRAAFEREGVANEAYLSRSAFWIIRRDAIDQVYELAMQFSNNAKSEGLLIHGDAALGFAMQMLCGNPDAHCVHRRPDLWSSDGLAISRDPVSQKVNWQWTHPLGGQSVTVRPAILHLGHKSRSVSAVSPAVENLPCGRPGDVDLVEASS
jgi:hypothetical protein